MSLLSWDNSVSPIFSALSIFVFNAEACPWRMPNVDPEKSSVNKSYKQEYMGEQTYGQKKGETSTNLHRVIALIG